MNARDFLDASKRIEEAATEGPWFAGAGWVYYDTGVESDGSFQNRSVFGTKHLLPPDSVTPDPDVQANVDLVTFARTALPKMRAALEAVLALHEPRRVHPAQQGWLGAKWWCDACDKKVSADRYGVPKVPCPTVRAIESALTEGEK